MKNYPDLKTAISLWQESLSGVIAIASPKGAREYIFHTTGVAEAASSIASKCGLDEEKAFIVGLLHDWGKIQKQKETGKSHFMVGYEKMIENGWTEAANICLSHSFPDPDFDVKDYPSYPLSDLEKAKELISQRKYDDYDRLIQLCDIFFEGTTKISYQRRIACIRERYGLTKDQTQVLESKAAENKTYFDKKCGCDIYNLLCIEE